MSEYQRPLTAAEAICEQVGSWFMVRNPNSRRSPKKTHVPDLKADEPATLCRVEEKEFYNEAIVITKDWAAVPLDHYPMCNECERLLIRGPTR